MQGDIIQTYTKRGLPGYGAALLVKPPKETLYELYMALETVPSVYGTTESFDINILTDLTKGKVMGKDELDDKEVEFLLHRDNVRRAKMFEKQTLDWLVVYQDGTGYKFTATTNVRSNDAEGDVLRGTIVFIPLSAEPLMDDVRDLIRPTIQFTTTIPFRTSFASTSEKQSIVVKTDPATATVKAKSNSNMFTVNSTGGTAGETATITDGNLEIAVASGITDGAYGIITITAEDSTKKYASWETTIAVEYHA